MITVVLAAVAVGLYVVWSSRSNGADGSDQSADPNVVAELAGDGDETTDSFDVDEGWQIHWENTGERFAFAITGDTDFGTVIEQDGPGNGITSPVGSGTFQMEVSAEGSWEIQIIQGEPPE